MSNYWNSLKGSADTMKMRNNILEFDFTIFRMI